ncbi:MAG: helix-turn-helix domain-containing protein [Oligoflexales bacterium]
MTPLGQSARIKEGIKNLMRGQKRTYDDLAKELGLSVPTIKRLLNQEEITLERLLKILKWLNTDLEDLLEIVKLSTKRYVEPFTEKQEDFLSSSPEYFAYFGLLMDNYTPDEIAKLYDLNPFSTEKYLRELEKLELIGIGATGVFVRVRKSMIPGGALHRTRLRHLIAKTGAFFAAKSEEVASIAGGNPNFDGMMLDYGEHKITYDSYKDFCIKERQLRQEIRSKGKIEERSLASSDLGRLFRVSWYVYDQPGTQPKLPTLGNIYGDIVQLE